MTQQQSPPDSGFSLRQWRMPPLVLATCALHLVLPIAWWLMPGAWVWWLAALVSNHVVLAATGLWPRSTWLGSNWTKLPPTSETREEIALTIDDGPDPDVTPKVLDLLDRYGVKATFFCIGKRAQRYPDLCRAIVARGHAVENHSYHHRHNFSLLGPSGFARELGLAQKTLKEITGRAPRFFRAPAGLRNPFLDPILAQHNLQLAAWSTRGYDTRTGDVDRVMQRLAPGIKAGAILLVHDGNCARTSGEQPVILELLPRLIDTAHQAKLTFVTLPQALDTTHIHKV